MATKAVASVGEMAGKAASSVGEMAGKAASSVGEMAGKAASSVGEMAGKAASAASHTAGNVTSAAGSGLRSLGETISDKGPQEGFFGGAAHAVGGTLKQGGKYLEEEGLSGMMDDVAQLIRRNAIPAVLIGVGVGFLLGRMVRT
jgi:hypothetical protein